MDINEGATDIETCPTSLAKSLMPSRRTAKNPLREQSSKTDSITTNSNSSSSVTPAPFQLPPPLPSYPPYLYADSYRHPTYSQHQQYSPQTPRAPRTSILASSPISHEIGDNQHKLANYFDWLLEVYPAMTDQLKGCWMILDREEIVFGTLLNVPKELWNDWSITSGIRILVTTHTKKWEHEQAKGRC